MKVKVKMFWPIFVTESKTVEIDVPDGVNTERWIYEHERELLEKESGEDNLRGAIDAGYAQIDIIEDDEFANKQENK